MTVRSIIELISGVILPDYYSWMLDMVAVVIATLMLVMIIGLFFLPFKKLFR